MCSSSSIREKGVIHLFSLNMNYWLYIVMLCLISGWHLLQVDAKKYAAAGMATEHKASRIMGWMNIALGLLVLLAQWGFGIFYE